VSHTSGPRLAKHLHNFSSIAFYPFGAIFSLYYNILDPSNPTESNEDIRRLEKLEAILVQASHSRFEYVSIARAVAQLNRITKHLQRARAPQNETLLWSATPPYHEIMAQGFGDPSILNPDQDDVQGPAVPAMTHHMDTENLFVFSDADFTEILPSNNDGQISSMDDFQHLMSTANFEPLSYLQQVETQFLGRNTTHGKNSGY